MNIEDDKVLDGSALFEAKRQKHELAKTSLTEDKAKLLQIAADYQKQHLEALLSELTVDNMTETFFICRKKAKKFI